MLDIQDNDILNDRGVEAHRQAYNAAFDELGLNWYWDPITYACLPAAGRDGLRAYLQTEQAHLLRAYDLDFLTEAIETAKARCYGVMLAHSASTANHGRTAASPARPPA
jgi:hypothetical protein